MSVLGAGLKTDFQRCDNHISVVCPELFNEDMSGSVNSVSYELRIA